MCRPSVVSRWEVVALETCVKHHLDETYTDPRLQTVFFSAPPTPKLHHRKLPLWSKHLTRKVVVLKVQLPQLSEPAQLRRDVTFSGTLKFRGLESPVRTSVRDETGRVRLEES